MEVMVLSSHCLKTDCIRRTGDGYASGYHPLLYDDSGSSQPGITAGTYAKGGEIFVLDMGSPVKIDTLARNLIKLSGLKPDIDIKIEYTGLRPGEKLYEEKLMAEEGLKKTPNDLIHIGCPIPFEVEGFLKHLQSLMEMAYANDEHIREKVSEIVTTYHPAGEHGSEKKGEVYERLLGGKTAENGQK